MSFTDQKRRVATEADVKARWGGVPDGKRFRCYMCGHRFKVGDGWRWVYGNGRGFELEDGKMSGVLNFMVCDNCDGEDVLDRWVQMNKEFETKYWWASHNEFRYEG